MGFQDVTAVIQNLHTWNPDKDYIRKDLTFVSKPLRNTCWQRFKAIFIKSKSKEVITALETLKEYAESNKLALAANPKLRKELSDFNRKVRETLVKKNENHHSIKNKQRKAQLKQLCKDISAISSEIKHYKLPDACKSAYNINSSEELEDFIFGDLEKFIFNVESKSPDQKSLNKEKNSQEAAEILNALVVTLSANPSIIELENTNLLFQQLFRIKEALIEKGDKSAQKDLRRSYLAVSVLLRKQFFAERLAKAEQEVKEIKKRVTKTTSPVVQGIIKEWERKLKKAKLPSIPKYYHCTPSKTVNTIIHDPIGICPQPKRKRKGYPGAFASTTPEMAASGGYGNYCFALSSYIEDKAQGAPPIVTNVNSGNPTYGVDPIYIGETSNGVKGKRPKLWLGFKQPFSFIKPEKTDDPIGYYQETTWSLMAMIGKPGQFPILDAKSVDVLAKQKIKLLEKGDFDELCHLVHSSIPVVLPEDWGSNVKCPYNCSLVPRNGKPGAVALKDMKGVQV